eukprot:scaffold34890_cov54-Cyclotella_meneghiniana.AAC.6
MQSKVPQVWPQSTCRDTQDAYYAEQSQFYKHSNAKCSRFFPDEDRGFSSRPQEYQSRVQKNSEKRAICPLPSKTAPNALKPIQTITGDGQTTLTIMSLHRQFQSDC